MSYPIAVAIAGALRLAPPAEAPPPRPAPAIDLDPATARAAADVAQGNRHFEAGHFSEAAALYASAHALQPSADTLYRWAQAERRAGNCPVAAQLYRRYLAHDVAPENAAAARKNLLRCGYADDPSEAAASSPAAPEKAVTTPTPEDTPPRAWVRDPAGASLVAIGGAATLGAAVLGAGSAAEIRRANDAAVEDDYVRHAGRSRSLRIAAITTGSIGAALLVGGIVRWIVVARRARSARVAPATGTALLSIRF